MPSKKKAADKCVVCAGPGKLRCADCKAVKYCSLECTDANWRFHKHLCATFKDFDTAPNENTFRALYLWPDEDTPRFAWVDKKFFKSGGSGRIIDLLPGSEMFQQTIIRKGELGGPLQTRNMTMFYDEYFQYNYARVNKAVVALTQGQQGFAWRGPIIVCAANPGQADFNMADVRHLVTFFITYTVPRRFDFITEHNGPKIQAVMMPCNGEKRLDDKAAPQPVLVPRLHYIWDAKDDISAVSQLIGMPLFAVPSLINSPKWASAGDVINTAAWMHTNGIPNPAFDDEKTTFWLKSQVGNMLVARVDRRPLDPDTAEAFSDFCKLQLMPSMATDALLSGGSPGGPQAGLDQCTPEKWAVYLAQWKKLKEYNVAVAANTERPEGVTEDTIDGVPRMCLTKDDSFKLAKRLFGLTI